MIAASKLPCGAGRVAFREEHAPERHLAARLQCRRRIPRDDLGESLDGRPGQRQVAGRDGDLRLGRQQSRSSPAIPGLVGDRGVDAGCRRLDLPLREADECQRGLRRAAAFVRVSQGRLGAGEVAPEPADVADRVEPVRLRRRGVEPTELGRRLLQLLLGAVPGSRHRGDFGAVDTTDAWEAREGLTIAIPLGGLDPLARPAIVGQVPTGADHPAGGDPGRER